MKTFIKFFTLAILFVAALICAFVLWLYLGKFDNFKSKIFQKFNLPIAVINNRPIGVKDFLERFNAVNKMTVSFTGDQSNAQILKQSVYNQFVEDAETLLLAKEKGVLPTSSEIDTEYSMRADQAKIRGGTELETQLVSYGLTVETYKKQSIEPYLAKLKLKIWFNSQSSLNTELYGKAQNLVTQVSNGAKLSDLAKQYSEDATEKSLEGDLGFVTSSSLLPEVREQVDSMKVGELKIIPSRFGLHLIKLEAINSNQVHIRQIFFANPAFENWEKQEFSNFKIKKLIDSF